jgi:type II secretory pathway pseudopilin PulG
VNGYARNGFTLVELMAASIATVILVGAVFGVLGGITRDRQKLVAARLSDRSAVDSVVELLRHDLLSATSLRNADGTVVLHTFNRLDPDGLEPTERPTIVTYRVEDEGSIPCLLRRQVTIDEPVPPSPFSALVACHVRKIEVKEFPPDREQKDHTVEMTPQSDRVPNQIRLHVEFDDSSAAIDQVLCLR